MLLFLPIVLVAVISRFADFDALSVRDGGSESNLSTEQRTAVFQQRRGQNGNLTQLSFMLYALLNGACILRSTMYVAALGLHVLSWSGSAGVAKVLSFRGPFAYVRALVSISSASKG